jgi:hypothetical protein
MSVQEGGDEVQPAQAPNEDYEVVEGEEARQGG